MTDVEIKDQAVKTPEQIAAEAKAAAEAQAAATKAPAEPAKA